MQLTGLDNSAYNFKQKQYSSLLKLYIYITHLIHTNKYLRYRAFLATQNTQVFVVLSKDIICMEYGKETFILKVQ